VEVRVGPLELAGEQYILGLSRDITDRQRMQEAMIQSEKMMTVGGLAAGMAHEINNPLSGILQGIQNTQRRISPDFDANQKVADECGVDLQAMNEYLKRREVLDFLTGIHGAGTRAARIIRNMLQFSRPGVTEPTPADLGKLLDRTLDLARADFDLKKKYDFRSIQVERTFDRTLGEVPCMANELEQVVLNIMKNAAEAMAEQKERDEPRRLILRTLRENGWARIEIADNGPGMDEDVRRRVFEPFFTTKAVGSGTGLGLAVSYFIITSNHRGTIDVEAQPGKGAKFIIRLPLQ
jgi:signal transduction histidine kinase